MAGERDPAVREATRGAVMGGLALICMALIAATIIVGYVLVTEFVYGR